MGPNLPKGKLFLNGIEIGEVQPVEFSESPIVENDRTLSLNYEWEGTITIDKKSSKNLKRFIKRKIRKMKFQRLLDKLKGVLNI